MRAGPHILKKSDNYYSLTIGGALVQRAALGLSHTSICKSGLLIITGGGVLELMGSLTDVSQHSFYTCTDVSFIAQ